MRDKVALWATIGALLLPLAVGRAQNDDGLNCSRTYTESADFMEGILVNLTADAVSGQVQLSEVTGSLPFIWVACSGRGTTVRIDVNSGQVLGEYRTAPQGRGLNPSRTTVDLFGNCWVSNRDEGGPIDGVPAGSVVKFGLVIGGTRVRKNEDGSTTPDPTGGYLEPPFLYSTVADRDNDGLIRTSRGLGDILPWPDMGDGMGGPDGLVMDAEDETILIYQRLPDADGPRHVSVDADNNVWVGGYPYALRSFHKLDGETGAILDSFNARDIGAGGYGGLIDGNGILWSASLSTGNLLRYDTNTGMGVAIPMNGSYGLGIDTNGFIWNSLWSNNAIVKIAPDGTIQPGFPKPTGGASNDRGVAVTPIDNNIWVANSGGSDVSRLDNDGNVLKVIPVGNTPTGVAVDANGKVWVTNYGSHSTMRIDPSAGSDGLGEVDLTVDLGPGASPYNYSDMTGAVLLGAVRQGTWTVVHDSQVEGTEWGRVSWNEEPEGSEPEGTSIRVFVRASDNEAGLAGQGYLQVENGVSFCSGEVPDRAAEGVAGRYIQLRVVLGREQGIDVSPVLSDLRVNCCAAEPPSVPDLIAPAADSATSPLPDFRLVSTDPTGSAVRYTIEVTQGETTLTFETDPQASGQEASYLVPEDEPLAPGDWTWRAKAVNDGGLEGEWSASQAFRVAAYVPAFSVRAGLNTFGVPITAPPGDNRQPSGFTPADFNLEGVPIAPWLAASQEYYLDGVTAFDLGVGYWVRVDDPVPVRFEGNELTGDFAVPLLEGWNFISAPFLDPVAWDLMALRVRRGSEEKSLLEARDAGWMEVFSWGWEQDSEDVYSGRYFLICDSSLIPGIPDQLEPWRAYWVMANTDCDLVLPKPALASRAQTAPMSGWTLSLQVQAPAGTERVTLGVSEGRALAGSLPPEPPGGRQIHAGLVRGDRTLAIDLRPGLQQKQTWELAVAAPGGDGELTIAWPDLRSVPGDVSLTLVDPANGVRRSLRTTQHYIYRPPAGTATHRLQVVAERGRERPLQVSSLRATPTRGGGLDVRFSLSREAQTTIQVRSLNGRAVNLIEEQRTRSSGENSIAWQARDINGRPLPPGVYLLEVQALDDEGRQVRAVVTVSLR